MISQYSLDNIIYPSMREQLKCGLGEASKLNAIRDINLSVRMTLNLSFMPLKLLTRNVVMYG